MKDTFHKLYFLPYLSLKTQRIKYRNTSTYHRLQKSIW